jgi:hypothetical protein
MPVNKEIKSNRLLASRRYTHDDIADSQDNFTRVLDLGESEIYSQTSLIPTSSIPLLAANEIYSASLGGDPIMKYWYRQQMTPSGRSGANGRTEVWFFIDPYPGTTSTPFAINANQVTNFISNKYAAPGLASNNAETAGASRAYNVIVYKNGTSTQVAETDFVFDYKTGVFEFITNAAAAGVSSLFITAYQYVGRTLASDIVLGYSGSFSGSFQGNATLNNLTLTGSFNHTGSQFHIGNTTQTGSVYQTGSIFLTGSIDVVGPIISNGINVVDNAIAMAIALG